MIRWKQTHTGVVITCLLAGSILLFYLFAIAPFIVPTFITVIVYFLPPIFIAGALDHGHADVPWSIRWKRLVLSCLVIFAWMVVGADFIDMLATTQTPFYVWPNNAIDLWDLIWPALIYSVVLAIFGNALVGWIERRYAKRFEVKKSSKRVKRLVTKKI